MKVRFKSNKSVYGIDTKIYHPNDVAEIPDRYFNPYFMEKIETQQKKEEPKVEEPVEESSEISELLMTTATTQETVKVKPKARKKT